ncbi:MAG: agmatinase [Bacteroidales bacterium]
MRNYGGLAEEYTQKDSSAIAILPVPYDGSSTWIKGADKGPEALIEASENMELYDIETGTEVYKYGIYTGTPVIIDGTPEEMAQRVKDNISRLLDIDKFVVTIGGEHSVSIGAFQAFSEKFKELSILQLDAHSDLRDEYEGSRYNHACVMARARELAEIVQVGIRSMDSIEIGNMDKNRVFFGHDIRLNNKWHSDAISLLKENVYLTIDLDVFDPSSVPSTGTPEPGGMNYYQVLDFLKEVIKEKNVVGFDVVELCPIPGHKSSDFLASKLIYQLLSLIFLNK